MTREKEWDGIAACHQRINVVTTWTFDQMKMGRHKLIHQRFNGQYNVVALVLAFILYYYF
jgi:U3 small nucleolar RNA-associated protein 21